MIRRRRGLDPVTSQTIIALILRLRDIYGVTGAVGDAPVTGRFCVGKFSFRYGDESSVAEQSQARGRESDGSESSTRFAVLRDGKVFFEGTPEELEAVKDPYLKRFLV